MNRIASAAATALLMAGILLAGCQALTPPEPTTPAEAVGVAYSTITAIANTTTARLQAGAITAEQASEILDILQNADNIADTAKVAIDAGRADDATAYLAIATNILIQLEAKIR